ncbi:hypothetical protein HNR22_005529 [Micromonospora jinlongensis]|uniref:RNA polymerase sigma-70 factor, ECF subfamily n=1 Tax=Micromonospora jinlongensis TaxID=1287877 RepID=A0A7Y9X7F2_9ACTN|nr:hypothetical protein [Micromonospora jinlongensis]NYH45802.1 hypothetical protein [Micromonospora jinlongensis]
MAGDRERAIVDYRAAAARTSSLPEQRYLTMRAARLAAEPGDVLAPVRPARRR